MVTCASAARKRTIRDSKPQRQVLGSRDPNAWRRADLESGFQRASCTCRADRGRGYPQRLSARQVPAIQAPVDRQRLAQPRRAARQLANANLRLALCIARPVTCRDIRRPAQQAPLFHKLNSRQGFQRSQQHGMRDPRRLGNDVQAPPRVDRIHVRVPRRTEHARIPPRRPAISMARGIMLSQIGLHLDDPPRRETGRCVPTKRLPE